MTFERPDLLGLAPLAALLFALALFAHWRRLRRIEQRYDARALRRLFPVRLDRFPTRRLLLLLGAGVAIGLAAAGPDWITPEPPEPPPPLDLAVIVDVSPSMGAEDVLPTRIERARELVVRLADELPTVRLSLVVFSRWPYTLVPPTDDPDVVRYFAGSLAVEAVGERDRGSSLSGALGLARAALESRPTEGARQLVLVLSDGEVYDDPPSLERAAEELRAAGYDIWTAGLGTEAGTPVTMDGQPFREADGTPVLSRQNRTLLRDLASAGGGRYEDVTDGSGLESLVAELRALDGEAEEAKTPPLDAAFLLTLLAIPLLLWEGAADAGRTTMAVREERS